MLYTFLLSQFSDAWRLVINYLLEDNISIESPRKHKCHYPCLIRHCLRNTGAHCCSLLILAILVSILHSFKFGRIDGAHFRKSTPTLKKRGKNKAIKYVHMRTSRNKKGRGHGLAGLHYFFWSYLLFYKIETLLFLMNG